MKKLITGMLVASAALAMLAGTEGAYTQEAPDATYVREDRGTTINTQAMGEEGISGPRVRVQPRISVVQDEEKMEPELDAIAKESEKLENRICRGC
jgi:hypothetical protein